MSSSTILVVVELEKESKEQFSREEVGDLDMTIHVVMFSSSLNTSTAVFSFLKVSCNIGLSFKLFTLHFHSFALLNPYYLTYISALHANVLYLQPNLLFTTMTSFSYILLFSSSQTP